MLAYYEQGWKKIYQVLKKGLCKFAHIKDPVCGCEKDCVVTTDEKNPKRNNSKGWNW